MKLINIGIKQFYQISISVGIILLIIILFFILNIENTRKKVITNIIIGNKTVTHLLKFKENINTTTNLIETYDIYHAHQQVDNTLKSDLNFNDIEKKLNIDMMNLHKEEKLIFDLAKKRYKNLLQIEIKSFNAIKGLYIDATGAYTLHAQPNKQLAVNLLHSKEYFQTRNNFSQILDVLIEKVKNRNHNELLNLEIQQKNNILFLQLCIAISIVLAIIAYGFGHHDIIKPVSALMEHVNNILNGNIKSRNKVTIKNEIGILANALNSMCEAIESDIKERKKLELKTKESEKHFRDLIENSPIGLGIVNLKGDFLEVNHALCKILGYKKSELLKVTYPDVTYHEDLPKEKELQQQLLNEEIKTYKMDLRAIRKDGNITWINLNVFSLKNSNGEIETLVGQVQDINERKNHEKQLSELNQNITIALNKITQQEREEALLNKLNDMLQICLTAEEAYIRINLMAQQLFPALSGGIIIASNNNEQAITINQWGNEKNLQKNFALSNCLAIRSGNFYVFHGENTNILCNHYTIQNQAFDFGFPLIVQNELIGVLHFFSSDKNKYNDDLQKLVIDFSNVVKLSLANIRLREKLQEQSWRDALTGLYNRRYFDKVLSKQFEYYLSNNKSISVAMLDLDFFKKFNDTYGHEIGNDVLKIVGRLLLDSFNNNVARFGGEEFLVVLPNTDSNDAYKKMDQFREKIASEKIYLKDKIIQQITISIGIATAPLHTKNINILIQLADQAMYAAKKLGRNRVEIFKVLPK